MQDLVKLIAELGVTTGVMVYLVYWLTKRLQNDLSDIKHVLNDIKELLSK